MLIIIQAIYLSILQSVAWSVVTGILSEVPLTFRCSSIGLLDVPPAVHLEVPVLALPEVLLGVPPATTYGARQNSTRNLYWSCSRKMFKCFSSYSSASSFRYPSGSCSEIFWENSQDLFKEFLLGILKELLQIIF